MSGRWLCQWITSRSPSLKSKPQAVLLPWQERRPTWCEPAAGIRWRHKNLGSLIRFLTPALSWFSAGCSFRCRAFVWKPLPLIINGALRLFAVKEVVFLPGSFGNGNPGFCGGAVTVLLIYHTEVRELR